jgi:hypothetical protein
VLEERRSAVAQRQRPGELARVLRKALAPEEDHHGHEAAVRARDGQRQSLRPRRARTLRG